DLDGSFFREVLDTEEGAGYRFLVLGWGIAHPLRGIGLRGARAGILTCLPGKTLRETSHRLRVSHTLQQGHIIGGEAELDRDVLTNIRGLQGGGTLLSGTDTSLSPLRLSHLRLLKLGELLRLGLELRLLGGERLDQR